MAWAPKPHILNNGRVVHLNHSRHGWCGYINDDEGNLATVETWPTITGLRRALDAETARWETVTERQLRRAIEWAEATA